jgi:P27 family predicted phage terminase small subunit
MAGRRQKHPDMLAFRRAGRYRALEPITGEGVPAPPPCPESVTSDAREAWEALWSSTLSQTFADTDLPALHRWLFWTDQWMRTASYIHRFGPVERSARGQEVLRSRVRYLKACEGALLKLEESFGMTPLSRLRLGVTFSEARNAVDRLKQPMEPRLVDVGGDPRELFRTGSRPTDGEGG